MIKMIKSEHEHLDKDHRQWLYRLLTSRTYTESETLNRLKKRGVELKEAKSLVDEFRAMGLLDDKAYAKLYAESRTDWGAQRIRYELNRRGISADYIAQALDELEESDIEKARSMTEEWIQQGLDSNKIAGRLLRRGFSWKVINSLTETNDTEW